MFFKNSVLLFELFLIQLDQVQMLVKRSKSGLQMICLSAIPNGSSLEKNERSQESIKGLTRLLRASLILDSTISSSLMLLFGLIDLASPGG